jgi:hypothetical protein
LAEGDQLQAAIGPPAQPEYLRPVYANIANVNFTPHDFRLVFSQFLMPLQLGPDEVEARRVEVTPQSVADVLVPASLMHGLIVCCKPSSTTTLSSSVHLGSIRVGRRLASARRGTSD